MFPKINSLIVMHIDGLESFVRTEDLDELERSWPAKRKEIGEV